MREANLNLDENNDVNGTSVEGASSGRCSVDEQRRPDRQHATARKYGQLNKILVS